MSDRRALLTDREREIITGEADISSSYRYQTISRIRSRFDRLEGDLDVFQKHGDLLKEFREIVCEPVETPGQECSAPSRPDVDTLIEEFDVPAKGGEAEARRKREAIRAAYDHLKQVGKAGKSDFSSDVFPENTAGYDSPGGWWNMVQPRLKQLPGVVPSGNDWEYVDDEEAK